MRKFPDSFKFFCFAEDQLSRTFYEKVFSKSNIEIEIFESYGHLEIDKRDKSIPIIVDIFFKEYCPVCKKLMPPGRPPMQCSCGKMVRLGYIPIYELPKTKFGFVIAPYELPSKSMKALRKKGWRVTRVGENQSVLDLTAFIKCYVMEGTSDGKKTVSRKDSNEIGGSEYCME